MECLEHIVVAEQAQFRDEFLHEMAIVAEAVYNAFKPDKLLAKEKEYCEF